MEKQQIMYFLAGHRNYSFVLTKASAVDKCNKAGDVYGKMLQNPEFCAILEELVDFGISRYKVNYSYHYQDTNLVLYQKYTYEDACRLLNWERNEVPLNIGGYKYDKKTKTFPIFINYDKQDRDFQKRKKHGLRRCAEFPERNRTWHRCAAVCEKE